MRKFRLVGWVLFWALGCVLWWSSGEPTATAAGDQWTVPAAPPLLTNAGFECSVGYTQHSSAPENMVPNGWTLLFLSGAPNVSSTQLFYNKSCNPNNVVTHQEGFDTLVVRSQDIETLPTPGKPFDVVLYHRVPATWGGAYSLSAWMTSKCGSDAAADCPEGNYIEKAIGIDPHGGVDPNSPDIIWETNRGNLFWRNLYTSATALEEVNAFITVFARMTSPFQFHGNLGFMDAFSLIRAPLSALEDLPKTVAGGSELLIKWIGKQSPDVLIINRNGGTYRLYFDVQARALPNGKWGNLVEGATTVMSTTFQAPCLNTSYQFRVRSRAEQPPVSEGGEGVRPNHRYPGVWSKPQTVDFTMPATEPITPTLTITPTLYLPVAARTGSGGC